MGVTRFQQLLLFLWVLCASAVNQSSAIAAPLRDVETDHYVIHTDLERDLADDLAARADLMYREYARRLSSFAPRGDQQPFQLFLFARRADYTRPTQDKLPN